MTVPEKFIYLDYGNLNFYRDYFIGNMNESIVIKEEHIYTIQQYASDYYNEESYVYISNRSSDYSVDPLAYLKVDFSPKLLAIVLVIKETRKTSALFEENFIGKPFRIFTSLEEATQWAEKFKKAYESDSKESFPEDL